MSKFNKKGGEKVKRLEKQGVAKHLFISDFQIPDHNTQALKSLYKFITDFKPDTVHNVGDFINCTKVSKFDQDPRYHMNLVNEIDIGRKVLKELVTVTRTANPNAKIIWYEGNHESRLTKYLNKADQLAGLVDEGGEYIVSIPHLFNLKELGIQWIGENQRHTEIGAIEIEHGDRVSAKSGATAHKMIEARGTSGISGHTHRLAYVMLSQLERENWWIESGSFCNKEMDSPYMKRPGDWQNGFAVGIYHKKTKRMHPQVIPIFNNCFMFGEKLYTPDGK
jgi:UDP-2,3-diacylglucosamine pyrophosphatase LpxH